MLKLRYYILLFVLAFFAFFVVKFPASSALALALGDSQGVQYLPLEIQSVSGSVWDGALRGNAKALDQSMPVKVNWDFKWLSVFTLNPKALIDVTSADSKLKAKLALSSKKIDIQDLKGQVKAHLMNSLLKDMNVNISEPLVIEYLDLHINENKEVVNANGKLTWAGGETKYPDANKREQAKIMNPIDLMISSQEKVLKAKLLPQNDSTQVVGFANIDFNQSAEFGITPRLLQYQGITYPQNAKLDQPIFSQEILLNDN